MERSRLIVGRSITFLRAAVIALAIAIIPQGVWSALIGVNIKTSPSIPWAVVLMAALLVLYWRFLGKGSRRELLRAKRVPAPVFAWAVIAGLLAVGALTGAWIVLAQFIRIPGNVLPPMNGLSAAFIALAIVTGALISPVCEQAGIWGYGQVMLRREFSARAAVALSALIFSIAPHPPFHVALLPKTLFFFATGIAFAVSAELTDSILPGLLVHAVGLLTFFTLIWPYDPSRRLVSDGGADGWFFAHVAQAVILGALSVVAFNRLRDRVCRKSYS